MEQFKCPVCGGTLEISLLSSTAVCDSCGDRVQIGYDQTKEYRQLYHEAEKLACQNTAEGYTNAIELMSSIPFVKEAREKTESYRARLKDLREKQAARAESEKENSSREAWFGTALIVLVVLIVLAALAGAAVLVFRLVRGELSTQSTIVLAVVIAVLVIGAIVGKIRG